MNCEVIIRKLRTQKGYSQEYMAYELKISQKTYSNIENNKSLLTIEMVERIAFILEVPFFGIIASETAFTKALVKIVIKSRRILLSTWRVVNYIWKTIKAGSEKPVKE